MCCVVLDIVDPNRDGYVSLQEYMAFMISKETENVQSSEEIENAFRAITAGDRPYVTKEELYAVSKLVCLVIYLPKLKQKISLTAIIIHPQHCHFMKTYNSHEEKLDLIPQNQSHNSQILIWKISDSNMIHIA